MRGAARLLRELRRMVGTQGEEVAPEAPGGARSCGAAAPGGARSCCGASSCCRAGRGTAARPLYMRRWCSLPGVSLSGQQSPVISKVLHPSTAIKKRICTMICTMICTESSLYTAVGVRCVHWLCV